MTVAQRGQYSKDMANQDKSRLGNIERLTLLNVRDVIDITGFSSAHVYRLIEAGDMPAIRSGRAIRVRVADLEKWLKAHSGVAA